MIICIDVQYSPTFAQVGCVSFRDWPDGSPSHELAVSVPPAAEYETGQFYLRELPCLLAAIAELPQFPAVIVVDGYVWLGAQRPGLGHYLYNALSRQCPVIGVAKNSFQNNDMAVQVLRGKSSRPLYLTSVGIPVQTAYNHISEMHGEFRIPTLIKRADQLARGSVIPTS